MEEFKNLTESEQKMLSELGIKDAHRFIFGDTDLIMYDVPVYHTSRTILYKDFTKANIINQIREVIREFRPIILDCCPKALPIIGISADGLFYSEYTRGDFETCAECGEIFYTDNIKYDDEEVPYCEEHICEGVRVEDKGTYEADWGIDCN